MSRFFTTAQKKLLFILANGKCKICNTVLKKGWHADHIIPFSKGGTTDLSNGQALCPKCNQKKYNSMQQKLKDSFPFEYYDCQEKANRAISDCYQSGKKVATIEQSVGSGKTTVILRAIFEFISENDFDFAFIISPQKTTFNTFRDEGSSYYGLQVTTKLNQDLFNPIVNGYHAAVVTPNWISRNIELVKSYCKGKRIIAFGDEAHHNANGKSFGKALNILVNDVAEFSVLLSGTLFRSDNNFIEGIEYKENEDGTFSPKNIDYSYTHGQAVNEGINRPTKFYTIDGEVEYRYSDRLDSETQDIGTAITDKQKSNVFKSLFRKESSYMKDVFPKADSMLDQLRATHTTNKKAGGLIVCKNTTIANWVKKELIPDAKIVHSRLKEKDSVVSEKEEKKTNKVIEDFKNGDEKWIISVGMISEGTNIPRLQVLVWFTNITTLMMFIQILGRVIRVPNDRVVSKNPLKRIRNFAHVFIPAIPVFMEYAQKIMKEQMHVVELIEKEEKEDMSDFDSDGMPDFEDKPEYLPIDEVLGNHSIIEDEQFYCDPMAIKLQNKLMAKGYVNVSMQDTIEIIESIRNQPNSKSIELQCEELRESMKKQVSSMAGWIMHKKNPDALHYGEIVRRINNKLNKIVTNIFNADDRLLVPSMNLKQLKYRSSLIYQWNKKYGRTE